MSPIAVSTVLLTKNSLAGLQTYMPSMREVDDIIVLDGGSTDGTVEFLRQFDNVRIYDQPKEFLNNEGWIIHFSGMRNYGYSLAKHPWILCVDSDEALSEGLKQRVREIVTGQSPAAYYVHRTFLWNNKPVVMWKKSAGDHIRLFHLEGTNGCSKAIHERVMVHASTPKYFLEEEVLVPLLPARSVRSKMDRCIAIETEAIGKITWQRWFRWIFLRACVTVPRRILAHIASYGIPRLGPRYPWSLDYEQLRYTCLLCVKTMPLLWKPNPRWQPALSTTQYAHFKR